MSDLNIKDVKSSVEENNETLVVNLTNRFSQDLIASMMFFVFNAVCQHIDSNSDSDILNEKNNNSANRFFKEWSKAAKKQIKKEIYEINKKLNKGSLSYLGAISSFSLPSTEDYQNIYNKALKNVGELFQNNTNYNKD